MNKCKCFSCGLSWFLPQDNDEHATQHTCPRCGSDRVQYVLDRRLLAEMPIMNSTISGIPSGLGNGFRFQKWMTN